MLDWEWFTQPKTLSVFVYLLLSARHDEGVWRGITLKAGECVTSREKIAKATGLSEQEVRTSLSRLKSTKEITNKTTNKFSIITITNYASYQSLEDEGQPTNTPSNNQQITSNQPTNNQQITTNKNNKNKKNDKNDKNIDIPLFNSPKSEKFSMKNKLIESGCSEQLASDYMAIRNRKKAPDTYTAFMGIAREAERACIDLCEAIQECVLRNWVGFKADWYRRDHKSRYNPSDNTYDDNRTYDPELEKELAQKKALRQQQEEREIEEAKQRDTKRIEDIIYRRK